MPKEFMAIRQGQIIVPATNADAAILQEVKIGHPMRVELYQQSERSLQHHRLFYGGLVALAMEYYQPSDSLVTAYDRKLIKTTLQILVNDGLSAETANVVYKHALERLQKSRAANTELSPINREAFVDWLKVSVGHCDLIQLPDGSVLKKPRSISFQAMSQNEFNQFYKACFNVCWELIMRQHFADEAECQRVIDQLSRMG
jgi:hypothetical protein